MGQAVGVDGEAEGDQEGLDGIIDGIDEGTDGEHEGVTVGLEGIAVTGINLGTGDGAQVVLTF